MNGSYLLDTNIVIAIFAQEVAVQHQIAAATEVYVPSIVLGELYYGAQKSGRPQPNLARVEAFALGNTILGCTAPTAELYGEIKNVLRTKGRPLPENDVWIAAIALQYGLTLVTRDSHFNHIDGLGTEAW